MTIQVVNVSIDGDNIINSVDTKLYSSVLTGEIAGDPQQTISSVTISIPGLQPQVISVTHAGGKGTFMMHVAYDDLIKAANAQDGNGTGTINFIANNTTLVSPAQLDFVYKVDTVAPAAKDTGIQLDSVTGDNVVNVKDTQADKTTVTGTVTGEYQVGDKVTVTVNGKAYQTTVQAQGAFSVDVKTSDLTADSKVKATVEASDAVGNTAAAGVISTEQAYAVNLNTPTVQVALQDAALSIGETTAVTFTFSEKVTGFDLSDVSAANGTVTNLQTTDGGKTWTAVFTPASGVESAANVITVKPGSYQNEAGNDGAAGKSANYVIDTVAPEAGKLDAPDKTTDTTPVITGSGAEAGAQVTVAIKDVHGNVLETLTTTVDASGKYSVTPTAEIDIGEYSAVATVKDAAGNTSTTQDTGSVVAQGYHHKVWTVASSWNSTTGPVDYAGMKTGDGDDWLQIGNGDKNCWTYLAQGNLWNKNPAAGWAVVSTGAGDDRIDLGVAGCGSMFSYTEVNMGTGNDTFNVHGNIHGNARVLMGEGNDTLNVRLDIDDCAKVYMGAGDDTVHVKEDIENNALVDLGSGANTITVDRHVEDSSKIVAKTDPKVSEWHQNNTVLIRGDLKNKAQILLDDGNDVVTIEGGINNWAHVSMGDGNDQLFIGKSFGHGIGSASVDMGRGDDVVTYGGKTLDGVIDGGKGHDTLILTYGQDASVTSTPCNVTNLSTANIRGIEVIEMKGTNAVDVRYSDLLSDTSTKGPLMIKGDSNDKVDLGANNWNSDGADKQNLKDNSHNWWNCNDSWSKTGTKVVDNVTYDVYHHSAAGADLSNDVYIQQGIIVI